MRREHDIYSEDSNNFGRNLLKPQILKEAAKNKIDLSDSAILARNKSERLVKKVVNGIRLCIKVDNVDELEFYGAVYRAKTCLCVIYKNWNNPVFHIQDDMKISRLGGDFKERFQKIHEICSSNFVVILFPPVESHPDFEVVLRMGICEYGFNEDVMEWALTTLDRCRKRIMPYTRR